MYDFSSERENIVERANSHCLRLFDTWCDKRNITALAFLMPCSPMIDTTPGALRRLGGSGGRRSRSG
ncbi:hypothetical protein [Paraburkholderia caribensis]|uniref:hypothetical protein n=1 Tax=Paraburkholderia caribensis TaxID=75105 RepID=UPI0006D3B60E|nr:hypothetical protein [Paraburkholderia caribensis]ALP68030.1 hypothetical protein AN416_36350 [Paraburkholderia caribensis]